MTWSTALARGGGVLAVRGEAGMGKSSLLAATSSRGRGRQLQVLTATGVQSEAHLPFAGLHQLLRPILAGAEELPTPQRVAPQAAFGMTDTAAADQFLIGLAALQLLAQTAARSPLLLIADDAQWLDHPTSDALAFVARRLESEPIALVIALRDGYESSLAEVGLHELRVEPLDRVTAAALLDARAPDLAPAVRDRVLDEAEGNPLALVELPAALRSAHLVGEASLPTPLS